MIWHFEKCSSTTIGNKRLKSVEMNSFCRSEIQQQPDLIEKKGKNSDTFLYISINNKIVDYRMMNLADRWSKRENQEMIIKNPTLGNRRKKTTYATKPTHADEGETKPTTATTKKMFVRESEGVGYLYIFICIKRMIPETQRPSLHYDFIGRAADLPPSTKIHHVQ